jgi:hypothetical protein
MFNIIIDHDRECFDEFKKIFSFIYEELEKESIEWDKGRVDEKDIQNLGVLWKNKIVKSNNNIEFSGLVIYFAIKNIFEFLN